MLTTMALPSRAELGQHLPQLVLPHRVEADHGLVEEQHRCPGEDDRRDQQLLTHALGEGLAERVALLGELQAREQSLGLGLPAGGEPAGLRATKARCSQTVSIS